MNFTLFLILNVVGAWYVSEFVGKKRELGYQKSLILSLLFTPIIGYFLTCLSPKLPFEID